MEFSANAGVALDPAGTEIQIIHDLVDFSGKDVVEIGSGDGRMTRRFASSARSVLGIDPDTRGITQAVALLPESQRPKVKFQAGDITTMELPAAMFDVAVLSWSL
jgi:ubiquinone/menaquinone biosynthesis C-methylase UbiE